MKKFFAIYLSILCTYPILGNGATATCTTSSRAACLAEGGCEFTTIDGCGSCGSDKYNPIQNGCDDMDPNNPNTLPSDVCLSFCQTVDPGYFKNDAGTGQEQCPTNNIISAGDTDVMHIGNCSCTANTQLIKTTQNSVDKYYCGECGLGEPNTNGSITTCACYDAPGVNRVYGNGPVRSSTRTECECTAGATWQDGACKCGVNTYLTPTNDGYICQSCPTYSTSAVGSTNVNDCKCSAGKYLSPGTDGRYECKTCPEHSTSAVGSTNVNDCQCDDDFPKRILDENNNLIGCSACADNASFHNGSCQCNSGYYGDGTSSCTQCPIGTTTTIGATQRNECQMNHNT